MKLRIEEANRGRCFTPFEMQEFFNMPPLKIVYLIPETEPAQAAHAQRIRQEFYKYGLFPSHKEISMSQVESVHEFDNQLIGKEIDFVYTGAAKKRSYKDEVKDEGHWNDK